MAYPLSVVDGRKKCPQCEKIKSVDAFNKRNDRTGGLQSCCKQCRSEKHNDKDRAANKERNRQTRDYYNHPNRFKPRSRGDQLHTTDGDGNHIYFTIFKRNKPRHCELCVKVETRLCWHHWGDPEDNWGAWLCHRCHSGIESLIYWEEALPMIEEFKQACWEARIDGKTYKRGLQESRSGH